MFRLYSSSLYGIEAKIIEVEIDKSGGLFSFSIVGLPDKAIQEAKERVFLAIKNLGAKTLSRFNQKFVVNLAPADLKKEGAFFDLPIAIGCLLSTGQIKNFNTSDKLFVGELSLEGKTKKIKGALPIALKAKKEGFKYLILPKENAFEASLVKGIKLIPVESLEEAILWCEGRRKIEFKRNFSFKKEISFEVDLSQVKGQLKAKRALEIVAAGGHNLLMVGPPGGGKTLLAKSLISILPPLEEEEVIEVSSIYSSCGFLSEKVPIISFPPFRAPHHSSSHIAILGGGQIPRPGEVTLAHRGILFLDEMPEFQRNVLEGIREPLEEGKITISRAKQTLVFPAKFVLVGAMNPCPCGYLGDPERECKCSLSEIRRYQKKISGPLLDRIDLQIEVPRIEIKNLFQESNVEELRKIRERVKKAREIQKERNSKNLGKKFILNSFLSSREIEKICNLESKEKSILEKAISKYYLSARSYFKILKISRTIADLEGSEKVNSDHILEALNYRTKLGEIFI